jgi:hypothetical protein
MTQATLWHDMCILNIPSRYQVDNQRVIIQWYLTCPGCCKLALGTWIYFWLVHPVVFLERRYSTSETLMDEIEDLCRLLVH